MYLCINNCIANGSENNLDSSKYPLESGKVGGEVATGSYLAN